MTTIVSLVGITLAVAWLVTLLLHQTIDRALCVDFAIAVTGASLSGTVVVPWLGLSLTGANGVSLAGALLCGAGAAALLGAAHLVHFATLRCGSAPQRMRYKQSLYGWIRIDGHGEQ